MRPIGNDFNFDTDTGQNSCRIILTMSAKNLLALIVIGALLLPAQAEASSSDSLLGFGEQTGDEERQLEAKFDSHLSSRNLREWMKRLTAHPHHVGSPHGKKNVEFMLSLFRSWGYQAEIAEYRVLFPTPKLRALEMLAPEQFTAGLTEPALPGDSTSQQIGERLPPYNVYSIDGDVTGELVYVNYGLEADYEHLSQRGIHVRGRIVIARYGGSWRGIKPKIAAEHGAIGCIIYSDPRDDGYFQGDIYPHGPYRNQDGAQRGSVADMPLFPGDPLTPFVAATPDAKRLAISEAPTLTRIPVLPISYGDATPLLRNLGGPVAPPQWRGALPMTYHLGPGPAKVRLKLEFKWDLAPAYNVIARMPGSESPDQWIIRGNHHDAWVSGARDPVSGLVAMMEEARSIGQLAKAGWRPRRTLVYAAWDAEEPGLLGSTEWVEHHAADLRAKAALYINTDSNGRGFLSVGGSHTLERFVNQVGRDVGDPKQGISVLQRTIARQLSQGSGNTSLTPEGYLRIGALGSGSDYSPFLQHLGVPSLNLSYSGESGGGSYHSAYDSFDYYKRFGDPDFAYGITLARTTGRLTLRAANAEILPFDFTDLARTVSGYIDEIVKLAKNMRENTRRLNRSIQDGSLKVAANPFETYVPPTPKKPVPFLNFSALQNAAVHLRESARSYRRALDLAAPEDVSGEDLERLNRLLFQAEQSVTSREGLPGRPWYRHLLYAPGFYTGYGVKTLPAVREAIELRQWAKTENQTVLTAAAITSLAEQIRRATRTLKALPSTQ